MTDAPQRPHRATILVVDDTPDNLSLMSGMLQELYKVKVATNGVHALRIAAADPVPDLILLDVMMPKMDGYEVCKFLKANPRTRDVPVIFLTAKSQPEDEERGLELGAVDYITKPFSPALVLARVRNHLALKAAADYLRAQNFFLSHEVERRTEEIAGLNDGVRVQEIDLDLLKAVVTRLGGLLADDDAGAMGCLATYEDLLRAAFHERMDGVRDAMCSYDFAEAARRLKAAATEWQIEA